MTVTIAANKQGLVIIFKSKTGAPYSMDIIPWDEAGGFIASAQEFLDKFEERAL